MYIPAHQAACISERMMKPVVVAGLTGVVEIAAAATDTCTHLSDDTVKCWGANSWGQLGDGTTDARLTPVVIMGIP